MDYSALSELIVFTLMSLSILVMAVGFSVRAFLAPTLRELFGRRAGPDDIQLLAARLERLEDRLDGIERGVERIAEAKEFDRQLEAPRQG